MIWAWEVVFWTCLALTLYAYFAYPACIWLLARCLSAAAHAEQLAGAECPEVTLIVAAHNEQAVIEAKICNSLALDYPPGRLQVVIASDGSSDATPQIAARYQEMQEKGTVPICAQHPPGRSGKWGPSPFPVRLLDYARRRGKSAMLNVAIAETGGDILVLSDANTEYRPDAIRKLVRWFADPQVDVVCGRLLLNDPVGGTNVDGLYWRYETFLKTCEGKLGALLGANGAIYAIRRRAFVPIPDNTIIDDFVIPLLSKLRYQGRIAYDPEAVGTEETPPTIGSEFHRRARIGTGAYQSVPLLWKLLNPRYGWTAFAFLSHKILRWLVPFCLLGMLLSNLLLLDCPFFQAMFAAQAVVYALAVAGAYVRGRNLPCKLVRALTMFVGMNVALLVGFCRWLSSPQTGTWHRTSRDNPTQVHEPPAVVVQPTTRDN